MKNVLFTRSLKKLYYRCTILTLDIYDQKYVVHKTYLKITLLKGFFIQFTKRNTFQISLDLHSITIRNNSRNN